MHSNERDQHGRFVGCTYVLGDGSGCIKIGWCRGHRIESRIDELQCGNPRKIELVGFFPGVGQVHEARIHKALERCRVRGEWFLPDEEAWDLIEYEFDWPGYEVRRPSVVDVAVKH